MSTPKFENKFQQIVYYAKKFAVYCGEIARICGISNKTDEDVLGALSHIPEETLIGIVLEINEKYGQQLESENITPVAKLATQFSPSVTVEKILKDAKTFVDYLESNPDSKKKFFLYLKVMRTIVS